MMRADVKRRHRFSSALELVLNSLMSTADLMSYKIDGTKNGTLLILRFRPTRRGEDIDSHSGHNSTVEVKPEVQEEWWYYLLAALLGLIALVLLIWLLAWCCCGVGGCCVLGGTVHPHAAESGGGRAAGGRWAGCWCRPCCGLTCECCCRKRGPDRRQNANSRGVYWIETANADGKWEPASPCPACNNTTHNPLGSSGLSSDGSPNSGHGARRAKNHAHTHMRATPPNNGGLPTSGLQDQANGSTHGNEMYGGGGQGLASVETPPPREVQLQRPVKPAKDPAKEAKIWMPHSNPVRQINTSTK